MDQQTPREAPPGDQPAPDATSAPGAAPSPDPGATRTDEALPPPAFPPGSRRGAVRARHRAAAGGDDDLPEDAFIDPDEPIVRGPRRDTVPEDAFIDPDEPIARQESTISDDAFIDPDEPIVRTRPPAKPEDFEEVVRGSSDEGDFDADDVVVTGIGDDAHLDDLKAVKQYGDPFVAELVEKVGFLADQLRSRGESGLRTDSDMSRFEASLRAYCTGYLAGRREGGKG